MIEDIKRNIGESFEMCRFSISGMGKGLDFLTDFILFDSNPQIYQFHDNASVEERDTKIREKVYFKRNFNRFSL